MTRASHRLLGAALTPWVAGVALADEIVAPRNALQWEPPEYPEATLRARVPFLDPGREWERMDIWGSKELERGKLPCVVVCTAADIETR